jgi:hypothetical protein
LNVDDSICQESPSTRNPTTRSWALRFERRLKKIIVIYLWAALLEDTYLFLMAWLAPDIWFRVFHAGLPAGLETAFLRRSAGQWAPFALAQAVTLWRWQRNPVWLTVSAGVRISDLFTDLSYIIAVLALPTRRSTSTPPSPMHGGPSLWQLCSTVSCRFTRRVSPTCCASRRRARVCFRRGTSIQNLVNRLAEEATKSAQHLLTMCIRALDYCPPVDLGFGDYLRALITADADLVPDDDRGYRLAVIEGFRRRGIFPADVRTLAVDSLRWQGGEVDDLPGFKDLLKNLTLNWDQRTDREDIFNAMRANGALLHRWVRSDAVCSSACKGELSCAERMGLALDPATAPATIERDREGKPKVEVHSVRPVRRVGPDGQLLVDLVIEMTQKRIEPIDPDCPDGDTFKFRGGCTLIVDLERSQARYAVIKRITSEGRLRRQRDALRMPSQQPMYETYFGEDCSTEGMRFLSLHRT